VANEKDVKKCICFKPQISDNSFWLLILFVILSFVTLSSKYHYYTKTKFIITTTYFKNITNEWIL